MGIHFFSLKLYQEGLSPKILGSTCLAVGVLEQETNKQGNLTKRQGNKETHKPVYKSLDDRSRGRQRWRGDGQDQDCPAKSAKWICAPSLKNR